MKILLDTNIAIRWLTQELSRHARTVIELRTNQLFFSIVSLWEVALKPALAADQGVSLASIEDFVEDRAAWLPLRKEHIRRLTTLPAHHRDPFDRLLIAQALEEEFHLLSSDRKFKSYKGLALIS